MCEQCHQRSSSEGDTRAGTGGPWAHSQEAHTLAWGGSAQQQSSSAVLSGRLLLLTAAQALLLLQLLGYNHKWRVPYAVGFVGTRVGNARRNQAQSRLWKRRA